MTLLSCQLDQLDSSTRLLPSLGIFGKAWLRVRFTVRDLVGGHALVRVRLIRANLPAWGKIHHAVLPCRVGTPRLVEKTFLHLPFASPYPPKCARITFVDKMEANDALRRQLRGVAVYNGNFLWMVSGTRLSG